jgi:rubrerythrin
MSAKNPIEPMLKLALTTVANHYQYYHRASTAAQTPEVKALLMVLADTESELIDKLREMMVTGISEELSEIAESDLLDQEPDATPFDLTREESDPRIFVCNRARENEVKGYTFFLSIAARAKSRVISRLFEYLAYVKLVQVRRIRRVCGTF